MVLFIQHNDSEMNVRYSSFFLLGRSHCTDRLQFVSRLPADGDLGRFHLGASGGCGGEKVSFPAHFYASQAHHPFVDLCTLKMLRIGVSVLRR